jgi:hypothetical protein
MGQERREFGALRVVPRHLVRRAFAQMRSADVDVDSGRDAQPLAPLDVGLCIESLAVAALDACLGEYRVTEESAASRSDQRRGLPP